MPTRLHLTVEAVEIDAEEADKARQHAQNLRHLGVAVTIDNADFFAWIMEGRAASSWDAILGNPPYIRYQYFDAVQRDRAQRLFAVAEVPFTKRTNAWVPFLIASVLHLAPGGRLAMVVPAAILHILHAEGLRRLLEREMESITLLCLRDLIFANVLQGVVLLLAVKRCDATPEDFPTARLKIIDINGIEHLNHRDTETRRTHGEKRGENSLVPPLSQRGRGGQGVRAEAWERGPGVRILPPP